MWMSQFGARHNMRCQESQTHSLSFLDLEWMRLLTNVKCFGGSNELEIKRLKINHRRFAIDTSCYRMRRLFIYSNVLRILFDVFSNNNVCVVRCVCGLQGSNRRFVDWKDSNWSCFMCTICTFSQFIFKWKWIGRNWMHKKSAKFTTSNIYLQSKWVRWEEHSFGEHFNRIERN